ncbi:RNA polymerase sigma factor [Stakelama tenebrarum]|uniref:Sigma-70 family RNA polymerase sigma factor n=1 Tax=Stakelama tenebrarum TaxID=2711215 RepID=A0A6G6Y7H9_9SPHN|nr:sigma-70 family RNA polymerase sigma factor [Sphingosinithalassobacter tenebrarum]QIG80668.1 sigma-70 family RNA polymerase sigma factor [Sphingosinithalassobacter tenebrarum]
MDDSGRVYDELLVLHVRPGDRAALAIDVVQDSWIGIIRGISRLNDPAKFPAWAFGILRRRAASAVMATAGRRARQGEGDIEAAPDGGGEPGEALAIAQAFARLNTDQRVAASLFFVERLTLEEIALATDAPVGTVKSRIFHARKILKNALSGDMT